MKLPSVLVACALASVCSSGVLLAPRAAAAGAAPDLAPAVHQRAFPVSPNGYTPTVQDCPDSPPSIRDASSLSDAETQWLRQRRAKTVPVMQEFLSRMNISRFDVDSYFKKYAANESALPNIGLAFSGGGYRAMLTGGGALMAFDNRTANSTNTGHLGGLLQSSTYIAGLSGGSWLVGSVYVNNFTSIQDLVQASPGASGGFWSFDRSVLKGPESGFLDTSSYYLGLVDTVDDKSNAGFNTTITDVWARSLSYQLVNAEDGGPAYTWSSIASGGAFANADAPMPLVVADGRAPGQALTPQNTTDFEFTPWEFGTFDPTVYGFVPLQYLGTNFTNGAVSEGEQCVVGFDNAAFVMGTSSTLFNQIFSQLNSSLGLPTSFTNAIEDLTGDLGLTDIDIASYPNPFFGWNPDSNLGANSKELTLVDGGEDLQNLPLHPLIQPLRAVDVVFAVDSSADTTDENGAANWPNATALYATYQRTQNAQLQNGTAFPTIPDQNTIVNLGLNTRPTFFGCDDSPAPLIVYIPNYPYVFSSNVSTMTLTYDDAERNAVLANGYQVATFANGTIDKQWPACVGCAILARSFNRTRTSPPSICNTCLQRYCWNGTAANTSPAKYNPAPNGQIINLKSAAGDLQAPRVWAAVAALVAAAVALV